MSSPAPLDLIAWQLADSAFPSGSFAHSGGLEAAWQINFVSEHSLLDWLKSQIVQTGRGTLRFVQSAYLGEAPSDADRRCDLFLNNHVANRASRAQGAAFARAVSALNRSAADELTALARRTDVHLAPAFGFLASALGLELRQSLRLYLFMSLRGWTSAAVRLGIAGPMKCQAMQFELGPVLHELAAAEGVADEAPVQTPPLADLLQGNQDRLYSRLFQS